MLWDFVRGDHIQPTNHRQHTISLIFSFSRCFFFGNLNYKLDFSFLVSYRTYGFSSIQKCFLSIRSSMLFFNYV